MSDEADESRFIYTYKAALHRTSFVESAPPPKTNRKVQCAAPTQFDYKDPSVIKYQ